MKTILLGLPPEDRLEERLQRVRALAPEYRLLVTVDDAEIEAALDEIEIAAARVPRNLTARGKNLRWMQQWGAGADWLMNDPEAVAHPFVLTNASGIHAIPISEHILALMLALARHLPEVIRRQPSHEWRRPDRQRVRELAGTGARVGRQHRRGHRPGRHRWAHRPPAACSRCACDRRAPQPERPCRGRRAPGGPRRAPGGAARGGLGGDHGAAHARDAPPDRSARAGRHEADGLHHQYRARGDHRPGTTPEPLPADAPLWDLDNVIISPHYSGSTPAYEERAFALFEENLRRYLVGEPLINVVDKHLAYSPRGVGARP